MTSPLTRFIRFWRRGFYLALALLFTLVILADLRYWHVASEMRQAAFSLLVRHRIRTPAPDPAIVIVDIDEASLAALAGEYGRWPWPRQVFGEFLDHLEEQKPRAVIFDMLFSDPDLYNQESDSYFAEAVSRTGNTFFPFLRLDPSADSLSALSPAMIPGVTPAPGADTGATIAVVLPCFDAVLATGRLGINNIYPDPDGVAREYVVEQIDHGWRLLSLPARVAVAGLNPHAGEGGLFGTEEKDCIIPAIKKAIRRGMRVTGPLPPDVIFHDALKGRFDAVIALYHDQGLIPFKLLYFEDGVNLTLGLPFVRTSPDHGTAFDIAGKGIADPRSMIAAIKLACRLRGRS